ncbi:TonB-dependent receptor [Mucilaginibacter sp. dw_454]|uniref:TonB-dependent receptor n=1 Tax=Mucilaginibacter sp. dw_454 TaxID=2720079 RepID=UPI001BD52CDF|nr:TonB-dependent receptor [Mucilaginibacter sp. dw_454]
MIKQFTLAIFLLLITVSTLPAQNMGTLQGKVLTKDGQPAVGVSVFLVNTTYGAATDERGSFLLKAKAGTYQMRLTALDILTQKQSINITAGKTIQLPDIIIELSSFQLKDVVVTGQYAAQSLKNSVYMVRTITNEQIRLQNPTKVEDVLQQQLGFRFSNDMTLGTANVVMNGVAGQRVKILIDGVPLLDRLETRESLNQIDINNIDHIEIVDGPMSVSYGSDALGGVINLITKKPSGDRLDISGKVLEETAGKNYKGFKGSGNHLENLGLNWGHGSWQLGGNFTRNFFDGAVQGWLPKDQYLGNAVLGYRTNKLHIWYRLDGENDILRSDGTPNPNTAIETDAHYITYRWMHQLQGDWTASDRLSFNSAASYTDYSRRTQTTTLNTLTGDRRLTTGTGEQDESIFDTKFFKTTAQYRAAGQLLLQPGVEVNLTGSSGARMLGSPTVNDYAFFISGEWKPTTFLSLRPGVRFNKNSVYDAPPAIPSFNAKISLTKTVDLRLGYARGFRAPSLSELYFDFHDASHNIDGNPNLKAEYSNSFTSSLSFQPTGIGPVKWRSSLSGFFNAFDNLITNGYLSTGNQNLTYINIDKAKTAGANLDNTFTYKELEARIGFAYTGLYSPLDDAPVADVRYSWYPEVSSTIMYHLKKLKGDVSLFYKYNGTLPVYELDPNNAGVIHLAKRSAYSLADLSLNKQFRQLTFSCGVRNLFNVTNVNNTSLNVGGAHSTGGPVPLGYGRSYFLGLSFQFRKY